MKILIAGATGAAGRALTPHLIEHGHTVTGTTRSRTPGPGLITMDGLDPQSVRAAVAETEPDLIVHQMTALAGLKLGKPDTTFAATNRLRTEGTRNLVETGVPVIAQSFAGWPFARTGGPVKTEDDPLDPNPPKGARETHAAIRTLERLTVEAGGIVLRYGGFYGPTSDAFDLIRQRKFPLVGDGEGIWSFLHTDDIATGTLAAIEHGRPGEIYNVVDDEPAAVKDWLPFLAKALGASPPRRVPAWLAKLIAGPAAVAMMTESRGASNAKAKRELLWTPTHPTWRSYERDRPHRGARAAA
jgi:nucleoside-diphosphate-sugar epimerase